MKKIFFAVLAGSTLLFMTVFLSPQPANAAQVDVFEKVCSSGSDATACKEKASVKNDNPIYGKDGALTKIINLLSIIVGIAAIIGIMYAGLRFITSGNNPQQVTTARESVLYAVVALIVAATAQLLVRFIIGRM